MDAVRVLLLWQDAIQRCGQVAALVYFEGVESEPCLHAAQFARRAFCNSAGILSRFEKRTLYRENASRPVGFEITTRYEGIAEQEWTNVVAVNATRRRGVHLDRILHAEQPLDAFAIPNERVERGDKSTRVY